MWAEVDLRRTLKEELINMMHYCTVVGQLRILQEWTPNTEHTRTVPINVFK
jgi:hypothetical protein